MTLLRAERIKLLSTRSPWWCALIALVGGVGLSALDAQFGAADGVSVAGSQAGYSLALAVVMVLAALMITTEYRFGTIRSTFQAVPSRTNALLAKTVVAGVLCGVIGLLVAFGSWGVAWLFAPVADLALDSPADWRAVAGAGLVYAVAAVIAVAVGTLVRHTAGAVSLLLVYVLALESMVGLIPSVGADISKWLPFKLAGRFLYADSNPSTWSIGPWPALLLFTVWAAVLLAVGIASAERRDA